MQKYQIHKTEMEVSRLAYGCMNIGGRWDHDALDDQDRKTAETAIHTALECGFNLFDHADIYTFGKSEEVFGDILRKNKGLRDRMVLQSKCGIRFADPNQLYAIKRFDFSRQHILFSVDEILRRLQTTHLDILLLHRPDALVEPEEVARAFDALFAGGKVRYFGVSNHTPLQMDLLRKYVRQPIMFNQIELSLLRHELLNESIVSNCAQPSGVPYWGTVEYCRLHDIMIQAWSPLAHGRLLGIKDQNHPQYKVSALISKLAGEKQVSEEAIMLAWLLRHPAGIQPIIGTTKPERIRNSAQADQVKLTREEWYSLFVAARGGDLP